MNGPFDVPENVKMIVVDFAMQWPKTISTRELLVQLNALAARVYYEAKHEAS